MKKDVITCENNRTKSNGAKVEYGRL